MTGIAMRCAKRTVSGEGLSRAAVLALVAAGVDVTGCGNPQSAYGATCAPPECVSPTGSGSWWGGGGHYETGGTTNSGGFTWGGTVGNGGRTGTATDAATDSKIDGAADAATDATDASASDVTPPTDAGTKDHTAG